MFEIRGRRLANVVSVVCVASIVLLQLRKDSQITAFFGQVEIEDGKDDSPHKSVTTLLNDENRELETETEELQGSVSLLANISAKSEIVESQKDAHNASSAEQIEIERTPDVAPHESQATISNNFNESTDASSTRKSEESRSVAPGQSLVSNKTTDGDGDSKTSGAATVIRIPTQPAREAELFVKDQIISTETDHPLASCNVTTQIELLIPQDHNEPWTFRTFDSNGNEKLRGGDEFYFSFTNAGFKPDAAALVIDNDDGTYQLDFVETPITDVRSSGDRGTLEVFFQYSCGIGMMPEPKKENWTWTGATRLNQRLENFTKPSIRPFLKPKADFDFADYDRVASFGDSIINMFVRSRNFFLPNFSNTKYGSHLNYDTVDKFHKAILDRHGDELRTHSTKGALLLGSAVWDVLIDRPIDPNFEHHLEACKKLIIMSRESFPNTTVIWKLPQTMHVHRLALDCHKNRKCVERSKYMSNSRMVYLYEKQAALMRELEVPVLDTNNAYYLSDGYMMPKDGRHFTALINMEAIGWFYNQTSISRETDIS